jgi:uncharacterized protein YfaS (alpha-2-macroglobulin family)
MPGATATVTFDISNTGPKPQNLTLTYWYDDLSGNKAYQASQNVYLLPGQTVHRTAQVPYGAEGDYNIAVQGNAEDGTTATTDLNLNVSWLVVYLGLLAALAIAIIAISTGILIYKYKRTRTKTPREQET